MSIFQKGDFADHPVCHFHAALVSGWLCWTPSSPNKVCKSPQPATMPQFFHLHRGTPSHWQLPSSQDHRERELCQGEAGATCSDWTRGENLFYKWFGLLYCCEDFHYCHSAEHVIESSSHTCISVWAGGLLQDKCLALIFRWMLKEWEEVHLRVGQWLYNLLSLGY